MLLASVHMAEEVDNAALTIPRAIVAGMIFNGLIGFAMMVTVLYCLGDPESVLGTTTGFPFIQVFFNSVKTKGGAVGMTVVVLILTWACSTGITTTASRMTWSFARDKGTPFSSILSRVSRRTQVPVIAVFSVSTLAALLVLIYIGSYVAFNDVISLTITGFYGSYFFPCVFLLYHRLKGHIQPYGTQLSSNGNGNNGVSPTDISATTKLDSEIDEKKEGTLAPANTRTDYAAGDFNSGTEARLVWGPWKLPGIFGAINNAYACVYMIFVIFWSVWPPETPVSASTMNYSIVVTGGVMILSAVWYFVRGRHEYKGPVVDEEVVVVARRAHSVVAVEQHV
jgi:choline transport protein